MVSNDNDPNINENVIDKFDTAVDEFITDSNLLDRIVNGDENEVVTVGSGDVRSVAKLINDMETQINTAGTGWLTQAQTAATTATNKLNEFQSIYHGASATAPAGADVDTGDLWFDTTNSLLKIRTAVGTWQQISLASTGITFHGSSGTAPTTNLNAGDFWYDTGAGVLKVYKTDNGSQTWEAASYDYTKFVENNNGILRSSTGTWLGNIIDKNRHEVSTYGVYIGSDEHWITSMITPNYTKILGSRLIVSWFCPMVFGSGYIRKPGFDLQISIDGGTVYTSLGRTGTLRVDSYEYLEQFDFFLGTSLIDRPEINAATQYRFKMLHDFPYFNESVFLGYTGFHDLDNSIFYQSITAYEIGHQ